MADNSPTLFNLPVDSLVTILRKSGCKAMSTDLFNGHVAEGFALNADGTVDLFDYVTWLIGEKLENPPPRTPPMDGFDINSVNPTELAGWLTLYNNIGYEIPRGRMVKMFQSYHFRFKAKDNPRNLNFLRFAAFVVTHRPQKAKGASVKNYIEHKAEMNKRNKEASALGRDIGDLPEVKGIERRERCEYDFKAFCETYFPDTFKLEWSDDHLKCISKIEQSVLEGGLFALALPRGSGKTTLCEVGAIWAMLYAHRKFICLIGATEAAALEMLDSIKTEFETNELLEADFPEVCYPIACLEGIANRCAGQTYHRERTRITWTSNELVLPTIKGSKASGIIVRVAGITGRIRGMKYKRPDGKTVRPQLVIVDDPQTRESARSIEQNKNRIKILSGDILGLAGPGQKISGIMPCTIIEPGDMAATILDKEKHPEWNGEKAKLLYEFPSNMALWDEYAEIRAECLREDGNIKRATDFYAAHREEMDKGAVVGWPARFEKDEISAVQNAMNLLYRDEVAFLSEYQNEPLKEDLTEENILSADAIAAKLNGLDRRVVPLECTKITMFVDVQKKCLFYTICAWSDDFTGAVIDYGTYPEQKARRFSLDNINPTLQDFFPHSSIEAQLYSAMTELFKQEMKRVFVREDGAEMHIDKAAIDANWGTSTDIVYQYCRQCDFSGMIQPAHGRYVGASSKPMTEYRRKNGEKVGLNWYMPSIAGKRAIRHVVFDTNFWKSFIHSRLQVSIGDKGCLSLFGKNPLVHELYSEHLTAEYRVKTAGRGRIVDEWKLRPDRIDNHWLDCTTGCAMIASQLGSSLPQQLGIAPKKQPIKLSELKNGTLPPFTMQPIEVPAAQQRVKLKLSDLRRK